MKMNLTKCMLTRLVVNILNVKRVLVLAPIAYIHASSKKAFVVKAFILRVIYSRNQKFII